MRQALTASLTAHLLLIAALLLLRPPVRHVMPGPESVQVALIEASALEAPAPAVSPPPAPQPEKPRPATPDEDEGVRIEKTKPVKPPRTEPPPPAPSPPRPPATPATEAPPMPAVAPIGSSGLKGAVSTDASGFAYDYYLQLVRDRIGGLWTPPNGLAPGAEPLRCVVHFRLARDGQVSGLRLESASGVEFFDRSALRAVILASPLPPLPLGYASGGLGIHFGFEYAAP